MISVVASLPDAKLNKKRGSKRLGLFSRGRILLVLGLVMLDTLRRMLGDSRPIDQLMLGIEFLVLLLIAYEVWTGIKDRWVEKRRKNLVEKRIGEMRNAIARGQALQLGTPKSMNSAVAKWASDVDSWEKETSELLRLYSAHAETAFLIDVPFDVHSLGSIGEPFRYGKLVGRLQNLRGIIEKSEVYF
jgi:hypothetical protein